MIYLEITQKRNEIENHWCLYCKSRYKNLSSTWCNKKVLLCQKN